MNVTSGIVKKQVQSGRRGYAKQHDRLGCRLQSVHRTVASRSHTIRSCSFSFSWIISGVLDRFTDLRVAFFEGSVG